MGTRASFWDQGIESFQESPQGQVRQHDWCLGHRVCVDLNCREPIVSPAFPDDAARLFLQ